MKSIGTRIAVWYAVAATTTLAVVLVVGYHFLQRNLVRGLDLLNATEFRQIQSHLGPEFMTMSAAFQELRLREISDNASAQFYIELHLPGGDVLRSFNLNERDIPNPPRDAPMSASVGDLGEMRIAGFDLSPYRLVIATPLEPIRDVMSSFRLAAVVLTAVMLLVSLAIGRGLSRLLLRPMRLIRDTADRIRSDNLDQRIPVSEVQDELSDLARLLNATFDRLETSFNQIRRFTAEASHELKTPLSLIRLNAEKLQRDAAGNAMQAELAQAQIEEVTRLNKIVEDLLLLARADARAVELRLRREDVARFVEAFAQDASALAEHHGMGFSWQHEGTGSATFDPAWMHQVLLNLLANAVNASPDAAEIALHSEVFADGTWRLMMDDQGAGLPEHERERVFERFVRYPRSQRDHAQGATLSGSGLGLAICRSIVELHGGRIRAVDRPGGRGLRVVIEVPAAASPG
ncbi:HAMP domain-containing sensor histidine kinase [Roseateles sp.]|uniref:HAMP domain-containing sensor histidine kinase n=1 Tax=Roseateles sp. TaxID=1971397 RepID=UPI002F3F7AE9